MLFVKQRNKGHYETQPLSDKQRNNFDQFFLQDRLMYDHFNATFHAKVQKFGESKMANELAVVKNLFSKCQQNASICNFEEKRVKFSSERKKIGKLKAATYVDYMGLCSHICLNINCVKFISDFNGHF